MDTDTRIIRCINPDCSWEMDIQQPKDGTNPPSKYLEELKSLSYMCPDCGKGEFRLDWPVTDYRKCKRFGPDNIEVLPQPDGSYWVNYGITRGSQKFDSLGQMVEVLEKWTIDEIQHLSKQLEAMCKLQRYTRRLKKENIDP